MFQNDLKIKISTGQSRKTTTWVAQELYWSEFVAKLQSPIRMGESLAEYKAMPKAKQDELKDVGGFVGGLLQNGVRKNEYAGDRYLVTLDADAVAPGGTQAVLNAVDALGCAYVVYSTRKHEPAAPRLRIVVPLNRPATPDEYEPIARRLAAFLGISQFDPTTFQPVRLMYWPSASADSQYVYVYGDKPFLSVDGMLQTYQDWRNIAEWPEVPGAAKIRDRSARKQGNPLEKTGPVGAFCRIYSIEDAIAQFIPDAYEPAPMQPGRYTYTGGSTVGGAVLYDNGAFLYSHHATDPAGGRLSNAFDLVRLHMFGDADVDAKPDTPVTQLPSFKAMCEFAVSQQPVAALINQERYQNAVKDFQGTALPADAGDDTEWMSKLQVSSQTGLPNKTIDNILIILENDPLIKGRFYHDEFAQHCVKEAPLPWEQGQVYIRPKLWGDADDAGLRHYLEKMYSITGKEKAYDAVALSAMHHKRNKLIEYLDSLQWDGIPRLDTLLIDYFGAKDTEYTRLAVRKTLTAAVARARQPGIKFDTMLILAGKQGCGKSTFFRLLGKDWFSDSMSTFEGKEAVEQLHGFWIIEAGELKAMNKAEQNTVKQFMSKTEDVYRQPYGRHTSRFPRSCIIVGSTNEDEFLRDITGNRRFWPVDLGEVPAVKSVFKDLPLEVDQIWAEAQMRFQCGESLIITDDDAAKEAKAQQDRHMESLPKEGVVREFLAQKVTRDWQNKDLNARLDFYTFGKNSYEDDDLVERDRICAAEVWCECFRGDLKLMKKSDAAEINAILSRLEGWHRPAGTTRFGKYYGVQRGYVRV